MIFPMLILQKPNGKLKSKAVNAIIQWRLDVWADGDFDSLLLEGRAIQSRLSFNTKLNSTQLSRSFARLMFAGRVKSALRLLSDKATTVKPLSLDDLQPSCKSVREVLHEKHPPSHPVAARALLPSNSILNCDTSPIIFEEIDKVLIHK